VRINAHVAASETLQQFFSLCAQAGAGCAFAEGGNPEEKFATLAHRLLVAPLTLPDGRRVGYAELVDLTLQSLYRAADWAVGAATLLQLYEITSPTPGSMTMSVSAATEDLPVENVQEALFANVCSETHNPSDPFAYSELAARADRRAPYVGAFWTYLTLPRAVWPARDADRYDGPWRVRPAHPALVLNTRYDPATDYRNAVHMAELLAGSRLVTVEGWDTPRAIPGAHALTPTSSGTSSIGHFLRAVLPADPASSPSRPADANAVRLLPIHASDRALSTLALKAIPAGEESRTRARPIDRTWSRPGCRAR
jgi:hypothetical protein